MALLALGEAVAKQHGQSARSIPKLSAPSILRMLIQEADAVAQTTPQGVVLDWGCGLGQCAWLLSRRGLSVVAADIAPRGNAPPRLFLADRGIPFVPLTSPVRLPWEEESFDAVVSGGVLEHVPDLHGSLEKVWRVLRPAGVLYVFRFPQRYSVSELLARMSRRSVHATLMTVRQLDAILRAHRFKPFHAAHERFVPHLTALAGTPIYRARQWLDRVCWLCDTVGTRLPLVRELAGSFRIFARKASQ